MLPARDSLQLQGHTDSKVKGWKKTFHVWRLKEAGQLYLLWTKQTLRQKLYNIKKVGGNPTGS